MWPRPFASATTTVAKPRSEKGSAPFIPRDRIQDTFLSSGDAATAIAERTAQVDRSVLAAAHGLLADVPEGLSLLAVGGYGRRHLFPYSDVDLLLLFASDRLALANRESVAAFLRQLWDAGLRVSQSVRTPAECLEVHDQNVELNISLLDQRFLAGDRALYATVADRMPRFLRANREILVRNLARLTRERHAKFGGTLYHLEPNVKETPGGLRDFQLVAGWTSCATPGARSAGLRSRGVASRPSISWRACGVTFTARPAAIPTC